MDVLRDALTRLRQALEVMAAASDPVGEPVLQEKPLTKQTLLRHLANIALVDHSPNTSSDRDDADATLNADFHERESPHNSKAIVLAFSPDFKRPSDPV